MQARFDARPHGFLDASPHRLAYWRFGRGPDLVFVHGWPLRAVTFRALVPLLADRFTCHLVDLPGCGQSESPDGAPLDFVSAAAAVRSVVGALGLRRYALVAHDSGGFIARLVAAEDRRVAGLVSGDTEIPGHTPAIIKMLLLATLVPGGAALLRLAMHARVVRHSPAGYGGCFTEPSYIDGDFHELLVAPLLRDGRALAKQVRILRGSIDRSFEDRIRSAHARIEAPVLFVWGELDPIFPVEKARAMLGQIAGGARLEVIPGGKAFVHEDRAAEFAAFAAPFLSRVLTADGVQIGSTV